MQGKDILCQINSNGSNVLTDFPFSMRLNMQHINLGTSMPLWVGEVPYIR